MKKPSPKINTKDLKNTHSFTLRRSSKKKLEVLAKKQNISMSAWLERKINYFYLIGNLS